MERIISVVASQPNKWKIGSALIMWELKTDYSHVSWVFWTQDRLKPRYYECHMTGGVSFTGQRYWEGRNKVMFRRDFIVSEEKYSEFLNSAMDKCGEKYGFLQNLGIKLKSVFRFTKNIFTEAKESSNCSELIYNFKEYINLQMNPDSDEDLVTPKDIIEAIRAMPLS